MPSKSYWPQRTITTTGTALDISPTSNGVYWLSLSEAEAGYPAPITPMRYDPTTGGMTKGSSLVGIFESVDLTVTSGRVWMVVAVGANVVIRQLDPSNLALHSTESLRVKDGVSPGGPPFVFPAMAATVNGPLWVAGGDDLFELNSTTGAVEAEFDTGDEIASISTDPSGNFLYTHGEIPGEEGGTVTEYDAQTGRELLRTSDGGIGPGTVAATYGGVWVSTRSGMAGGAFELSAKDLKLVAPAASERQGFGAFDQMMGVGSSVSEQTLWLTSLGQFNSYSLTCADPMSGAIRAGESASVTISAPVARGRLLYAVTSSGEVDVITPPAKCFE
jgi:hypothetical protein